MNITTVGHIPPDELESRIQPTNPKKPTKAQRRRIEIWNKYHHRCAYCGGVLAYKDMQVDHIHARSRGGKDDIENYNPSCRACNFYKGDGSIEWFRLQIGEQVRRLRKTQFIFRMAESFGLIKDTKKEVKFYFETVKTEK